MGFPVFKSFYQRIGYVLTTLGVKHVISTYQVLTDKIQFFQTVIESRSRNTQLLGGTLNGKITNSMTLPSTTGADWLECSILYLYYLSVICTNIVFILATFIVFGIFYDYQEHLSIVKLIEILPIWKWLLK